jgi:hydrogenase-4 component B
MAFLAALLLVLGGSALLWLKRTRPAERRPGTWDCGYARPTARMQYSASSFADGWSEFMPGMRKRGRRIRALFPRSIGFHSDFQDAVGEGFVAPRTEKLALKLLRYRGLQQGQLSMYLLYILITLVGVFLWLIVRPTLLG